MAGRGYAAVWMHTGRSAWRVTRPLEASVTTSQALAETACVEQEIGVRELLQRNASGEIVTVWWNSVTETVSLTVHRDMPDGSELVTADIPAVPQDNVLDVFAHPYAYAAHIGSISLPSHESTYASTEDDYPEDGGYGGVGAYPTDNDNHDGYYQDSEG